MPGSGEVGTVGGGGGDETDQEVSHTILYQMSHSGGAGFKVQITYTDSTGQDVPAESISGIWSQEITVQYPEVPIVAIAGNAVPDAAAQPPLGSQLPRVQCILWVDGAIVDQQASLRPTCEARLSASVAPPRSGSPSGPPSK
ncbi:hypothetical protein ACFP2T_21225 [Plantactinospora solaniradicis]|uniref:Uncharacterized protein n=1 Tax=Plantactinospora solaniradicis TaxID=1723736 RepID=A0ABW1KAU1_9ACTN